MSVSAAAIAAIAPISSAFPRQRPGRAIGWFASLAQRTLAIPLVAKLLGANALIVVAALGVHALVGTPSTVTFAGALVLGFALNTLLVRLALYPLDELEHVANAVSGGDLTARAAVLPTADRQVTRLAEAFNRLLERASSDRAKIQHLVRESLRARETERAALAMQLRDATAQQLAGVTLQLAAAIQANTNRAVAPMLEAAHGVATGMLDDVRRIADSVYPGLLGRLGLYPALEGIGRATRERTGINVLVDVSRSQRALPRTVTTALFGVAEEAMRNVERHSCARSVRISLSDNGDEVALVIEDDGTGFDPAAAEGTFSGIGLFRARELLAHAGGQLTLVSSPGHGTKIIATATVDAGDT